MQTREPDLALGEEWVQSLGVPHVPPADTTLEELEVTTLEYADEYTHHSHQHTNLEMLTRQTSAVHSCPGRRWDRLAVTYRKLGFRDWHRQRQSDAGQRCTRVWKMLRRRSREGNP